MESQNFNKAKNFIIAFIIGILLIAAGVANFAIGLFIPILLIIAGMFFVVISIICMAKFIKSHRKNKAISVKANQANIELNKAEPDKKNKESDKQSTENDLHKEKSKVTLKKTHYAEDSLLLLTYIKDKCSCSEPEILSDEEKDLFEKKVKNAVNNVFINRLDCNSICIYNPTDGIDCYPYGNWIEVKKGVELKDGINLYLELKDYVRNNKEESHSLAVWHPYQIWESNLTFFIVDKDIDLSDIDNQFAEKLRLNNIHLAAQEGELKFIDVLNSTKYLLEYDEEPCGVDWSGTVGYYHLMKIDSEAKSDEEKLSDELLCKILLNRAKAEYFNDVSLNQINIKIPIDKNSLYFLTVRVNSSTGVIKKFSFDIEEASDTHYEFDIFGAEKIRKICILNLHDSNYNYEESLNMLLSKYLNEYGELPLIRLVESISTAVFHFD